MKYKVQEKYKKCVVSDKDGEHILAKATQSELKKLYDSGHQDKIERAEKAEK
jgi:hypothetical protein